MARQKPIDRIATVLALGLILAGCNGFKKPTPKNFTGVFLQSKRSFSAGVIEMRYHLMETMRKARHFNHRLRNFARHAQAL